MKTYFSRLAGRFSKLNKRHLKGMNKELVIGFLGSVRAESINNEELNYLIHFYGSDKYEILKVEVLETYDGESSLPATNYNSFLRITYTPLPWNMRESDYVIIKNKNNSFKWDKTLKKDIA